MMFSFKYGEVLSEVAIIVIIVLDSPSSPRKTKFYLPSTQKSQWIFDFETFGELSIFCEKEQEF